MSEKIMKALMQLFAILTSQEGESTPTQNEFIENSLKLQSGSDRVPGVLTVSQENYN